MGFLLLYSGLLVDAGGIPCFQGGGFLKFMEQRAIASLLGPDIPLKATKH